ncbi:MAG: oligoendopeptidase F [Bacilli bacterium]|jgi:oligoendopeptidase F|nr:oligoendopeptidase F [Bacilli bacterium]
MNEKQKTRDQIKEKYKWDLTSFYKNLDDWYLDIDKINPLVEELVSYKEKIMANSSNLLTVLTKLDDLKRLINNLIVYAYLKYNEDTSNNESNITKGKIEKINSEVDEKIAFINTEILKEDYSLVKKYLNELDELKIYQYYLENLFRFKDHILSDKEEKIIASIGEILNTADDIYTVIKNADLKYGKIIIDNKEIEVTESNYIKLIKSDRQDIRKKVFKKLYETYDEFKNTFAATLKYNVKNNIFIAKTRKYTNPLQMSLYNNNIDLLVYDNLIKVVNNNLDILHKYIALKKKELNLKEFHMYDIYASMVSNSNKEYSYEDAVNIVINALKPLGDDYIRVVKKIFNERMIDVFTNKGKLSGAYSFGSYDSPPYIHLNYNNTLDSVFTLVHEVGHSVHSYYSNNKQPYIYHKYPIFTAEIASIVNEILLVRYLLNNTNDIKEKKILLNQMIELFKGTIYRQTMFAEFEKILYLKEQNNEVLTAKLISDIYYDLNKKYYGDSIIHDQEISLEWCRIPHFYSPFYVYQYATGLAAACAIVSDILDGKEETLINYKKFLASGNSDYPINLLKKVGVDMTTTKPIEKALNMFNDIIDEYINLN